MVPSIDATLTMLPPPLSQHLAPDHLAQVKGSDQIDVDGLPEQLERLVLGRDQVGHAGVVDETSTRPNRSMTSHSDVRPPPAG